MRPTQGTSFDPYLCGSFLRLFRGFWSQVLVGIELISGAPLAQEDQESPLGQNTDADS